MRTDQRKIWIGILLLCCFVPHNCGNTFRCIITYIFFWFWSIVARLIQVMKCRNMNRYLCNKYLRWSQCRGYSEIKCAKFSIVRSWLLPLAEVNSLFIYLPVKREICDVKFARAWDYLGCHPHDHSSRLYNNFCLETIQGSIIRIIHTKTK